MLVGRLLPFATRSPTIQVTATDVNAANSGGTQSGAVSGQSTATPTGAVGSVTYLWEHLSTSSGPTPSIDNAALQSPTFSATVSHGTNSVSTWRVTATDDLGSAQDTITVTLDWNDTETLSVTAADVNEIDGGPANNGQVSGSTQAIPSNENGIVQYLWEHLSTTSGNTPSINSTTTVNPVFTATVNESVNSVSTWRVTATDEDGLGQSAQHTITVTLNWNDVADLTVTCPDIDVTDSGTTTSGQVVGQANASVQGAVGSVTYDWQHLSTQSGNVPVCSNSTIEDPTFTATVHRDVDSVTTWSVTVTDGEGSIDSETVIVTLRWTDTDGDVPNCTAINVSSTNPGSLTVSGVRFNDDGSIDEIGPNATTFTQIHAGEWHPNEPGANLGTPWQIRCQSLDAGSDPWDFQPAAVGTWVDLSTSPVWRCSASGMFPETKDVNSVFQIRRKSDSVIVDTFAVDAQASS